MSSSGLIRIEKSLLRSKAFKELPGSPKYILFQFLCKRRFVKMNGSYQFVNDKELVFTYEDALNKHGYPASKFTRAIDELFKYGFISIEKYGGHAKGNWTLYGLSDRWKKYGTEDFIVKERSRLKFKPGKRGFTDKMKTA